MANMLDYIDWRGDLTFEQSPFNDIDNLIFTQLSYIDFDEIVTSPDQSGFISLEKAAEIFFEKKPPNEIQMGMLVPNDIVLLLQKMRKSNRYKDLKLTKFINKINYEKAQQFAALTLLLPDNKFVIAFRGTDDTIVGWKENFNMSFMSAVPSQLDAVKYVEKAAEEIEGNFYICGHSKGGNLSVYSALYCKDEFKDRIIKVYNDDGPGFIKSVVDTEEYIKISDRIKTIIPESSVVGILMEHDEKFTIVKSIYTGLLQHDAFSWELMGTEFIVTGERSSYSEISDMALRNWVNEINMDERVVFVDTLFDVLQSSDAKTLEALKNNKLESANAMIKSIKSLDEQKRNLLFNILTALLKDNVMAAIDTVLKPKESTANLDIKNTINQIKNSIPEGKEKKKDKKKQTKGKKYVTINRKAE